MRSNKISELSLGAADLAAQTQRLLDYLSAANVKRPPIYDPKEIILDRDVSIADIFSRVSNISEISSKLETSRNTIMVPIGRIQDLKQRIDETTKVIERLQNHLQSVIKNGGGLIEFDYSSFQLKLTNGSVQDVRSFFQAVADTSEQLLESFYRVILILRPSKATYSFQAAANALSKTIENSHAELEKIRDASSEVISLQNKVSELEKRSETQSSEITRLRENSADDRKTIAEYLADATDKKATLDNTISEGTALQADIKASREKLYEFDAKVQQRLTDLSTGKIAQAELFSDLESLRVRVEELIIKSDQMVKGATVAGLASSFADAHADLGEQLKKAKNSFYFGIFFLFASSLPLMLYVFLPLLALILGDTTPFIQNAASTIPDQSQTTGWQYIGQILARFIILLPAAWFVSFAAIRYSSLFRLREHYAYKYSMAVSVEGFKKEAPGYESEIAALVLEQLAFNPADKLVHSSKIKEGKMPNPIANFLLDKLRDKNENS